MGEENTPKVLIGVAIALIVILGIMGYVQNANQASRISELENKVDEITPASVPTAEQVAQKVVDQMNAIPSDVEVISSSESYTLTKEEYEDETTEEKAIELSLESVNSRDFKKAVYELLVEFDEDIESYKDITEVNIKDYSVDGNEVEFEVKVYYFTDDDEDNKMKAYLEEFVVSVDDLDYDENFEDAEVDESYLDTLSIEKVKEA